MMFKRNQVPKWGVLLLMLLLTLGFTWPWEEKPVEEKRAQPQSTSVRFQKVNPLSKSKKKQPETPRQVRVTSDFDKLENQIQDLMRVHRSLKVDSKRQISQIRRISEQTQIHKRILDDMETARGGAPSYTPSDIEELLRQEKIRLIQEQARRNQELLEQMNRRRDLEQNTRLTKEFERTQAIERHQKAIEESQRGSQLVGRS